MIKHSEPSRGTRRTFHKDDKAQIYVNKVEDETEFEIERTHKERYFILFLFSLAALMSSAGWMCFVPIFNKMMFAYSDANRLKIDYLNFIFLLAKVPMNYPAIYIIEKHGLRTSMLVGMSF